MGHRWIDAAQFFAARFSATLPRRSKRKRAFKRASCEFALAGRIGHHAIAHLARRLGGFSGHAGASGVAYWRFRVSEAAKRSVFAEP